MAIRYRVYHLPRFLEHGYGGKLGSVLLLSLSTFHGQR
nr:MAG TPA: hypothetical protein [Caudoviricetes sp.]